MLRLSRRYGYANSRRWIHCSRYVFNEISPSDPTEEIKRSDSKIIIRTGKLPWEKRILKDGEKQSTYPIYISPGAFHVSLSKRFSLLFMLGGGVIGEFFYASQTFSTLYAFLVAIPCMIPFPIIHYLTTPYVTRIFRLYDKQSQDTTNYKKLTKNEQFIIERLSFSGRSTYNTYANLNDLRIKSSRFGWSNWQLHSDDDNNTTTPLYVNDHVGGYRMDRLWGIIEKQSGIDNGR